MLKPIHTCHKEKTTLDFHEHLWYVLLNSIVMWMFCHIDHIVVPKAPFFRANKNRLQLQSLGLNFNFQLWLEKKQKKARKLGFFNVFYRLHSLVFSSVLLFSWNLKIRSWLGGLECGPATIILASQGWTSTLCLYVFNLRICWAREPELPWEFETFES